MSMTGLVRLIDTPFTINTNGAKSDTGSSGRNPYFALELTEEKNEEKDGSESASFSRIDDVAQINRFTLMAATRGNAPLPAETLHRISSVILAAFIPFQAPVSLQ